MSQQPYQSGNKIPAWSDQTKNIFSASTGIYKGLVKKVDTGTRSGRLFVYIEELSTATTNDPTGWVLVDYASPFMGKTLGPEQQTPNRIIQNNLTFTQQSYGFFMTPPDVGNIVLCCFPGGDTQSGYWFACVNPNLSKGMLPSIGGVPLNRVDPESVPPSFQSVLRPGQLYPVGEFNENDSSAFNSNWASRNLRPFHTPQFVRYFLQGLDTDANGRGVISSSIQRDPVSTVFGFSTPGRPANDPASNPDLAQSLSEGSVDPAEFQVRNRVGGHSLTMDDGDLYGKNNLVKLRTAAGHQILMNDTPGDEFMYIANSNGTAWIELTKEGDVLVYGQRDLSIRTRGNLMMHSDRLIQMNARGPIQMKSSALQIENQATIVNSEQAFSVQTNSASMVAKSGVNLIGQKINIQGLGKVAIDGALLALNSGGSAGAAQSLARGPSKLNQYSLPDAQFVQGQGWTAVDGVLKSINYKVPTHEPYVRGSIAELVEQQEQILSESLSSERTVDGNTENPIKLVNLTPGIDSADILGLRTDRAAPTDKFITQPLQQRGLGELDNLELSAYFAQTGFTQSNSNYNTESSDGYLGKYQIAPQTLINLGYLKPTAPRTAEGINNPNNWTGKNGVNSALEFRVNSSIQETVMYEYTQSNYAQLQNIGLIESNTPKDQIVGLLSASHFAGVEQTAVWSRKNASPVAGYTTAIADYYNQGRYSQSQVEIIQKSLYSKQIATTVPPTTFTST